MRHKARPMTQEPDLKIRLTPRGGVGPNAKWQWEVLDADGKVLKSGSHTGTEAKAFATARRARDELARA
jgi:hypothetical protein